MAARLGLNNFRFSIYIDADGTITLTDLPPELREVAEALDPSHQWGTACPLPAPPTCTAEPPERAEKKVGIQASSQTEGLQERNNPNAG